MGILMGIISFVIGLCINLIDSVAQEILQAVSYDLNLFVTVFPFAEQAANVFTACGLAFLMLGFIWQVFRGFGAPFGIEAENPLSLTAKVTLTWFAVVNSRQIISYITSFFQIILTGMQNASLGTGATAGKFLSSMVGTLLGAFTGISALVYIIVAIVLGWKFVKLLLEIVERYVVYCFIVFIAPVFIATAAFKSSKQTAETWFRAFIGQSLLIVLNFWSVRIFLSGVHQLTTGGALGTITLGYPTILVLLMCIAFLNFAMRIDSFLRILGLNTANTGTSLGQGLVGGAMKMIMGVKMVQGITGNATRSFEHAAQAVSGAAGRAGSPVTGAAGSPGASGASGAGSAGTVPGAGAPGTSGTAGAAQAAASNAGGAGKGGKTGGFWDSIKNMDNNGRTMGAVGDMLGFGAMRRAKNGFQAAEAAQQQNGIDYGKGTGIGASGQRGAERAHSAAAEAKDIIRGAGQPVATNGVGATNRYASLDDKMRLMNSSVSMTAGYQQEMHDRNLGQGGLGQIRQEQLATAGARAVASNAEMYQDSDGGMKPIVNYEGADAAAAMNGVFGFDNPKTDSFTLSKDADASGQHGITGVQFTDGSQVTWDGLQNGVATGVYTDKKGNSTAFNLVHDNAVGTQNMFAAEGRAGFAEFDKSKAVGKVGDGSGSTGFYVIPKEASAADSKTPYGRSASYADMHATVDVHNAQEVQQAAENLKGFIKNVHPDNYTVASARSGVEQVQQRMRGDGPRTRDAAFRYDANSI